MHSFKHYVIQIALRNCKVFHITSSHCMLNLINAKIINVYHFGNIKCYIQYFQLKFVSKILTLGSQIMSQERDLNIIRNNSNYLIIYIVSFSLVTVFTESLACVNCIVSYNTQCSVLCCILHMVANFCVSSIIPYCNIFIYFFCIENQELLLVQTDKQIHPSEIICLRHIAQYLLPS